MRPYGYDETARWVPRLWRRDIRAGHFSPMSHPQVMAAAVHDFADLAEGKPPSRALLRAQVGRPRGYFGDTLVSITGAGSGIGRETAFAFAREGAEMVDQRHRRGRRQGHRRPDRRPRRRRARLCARRVRRATPSRRSPSRSVPNTACPTSSSTTPASGRRADSWTPRPSSSTACWTSIWAGWSTAAGHSGSRLVERGTGGHIVNVSSMAAYAPLQSLNAYCTSKAATYMFSDCLRAELDAAGVGLTTICPGRHQHQHHQHHPLRRAGRTSDEHVDGRRGQLDKMFSLRRYGPDKVANAIVSAVKKNKPIRPGRAGGLRAVRRFPGAAAGAAQHRADAGDLSFSALRRRQSRLRSAAPAVTRRSRRGRPAPTGWSRRAGSTVTIRMRPRSRCAGRSD